MLIGESRKALAIRALPEDCRNTANVDRLAIFIEEEYFKRWVNNTLVYPGIPDMLQALVDLGIKMAILSNKPQAS